MKIFTKYLFLSNAFYIFALDINQINMSHKINYTDKDTGVTSDGLKAHAKKIKKEDPVPHNQAMDLAAQAVGYRNYNHFISQTK